MQFIVILALIIVILAAIVMFSSTSGTKQKSLASLQKEAALPEHVFQVKALIQSCLDDLALQATRALASNAGYLTLQPQESAPVSKTPLLLSHQQSFLLTLDDWESQIDAWIQQKIPSCLNAKKIPSVIITPSQPSASSTIQTDGTVIVALQFQVKIESPQTTYNLNPTYNTLAEVPLYQFHETLTTLLQPMRSDPATIDVITLLNSGFPTTITKEENDVIITLESPLKDKPPIVFKFALNPQQ